MSDFAILFDSSRCSACKGCQVACKCWNGLPSPMEKNVLGFTGSYQSPLDLNGDTRILISFNEQNGGQTGVQWAFGRRSCMHCYNPACVSVCPSGALSVNADTGFVTVNDEPCIGCKYCRSACPFDVPRHYGVNTKINKCDGCVDRIEQGRSPACVHTCSPGALQFGLRDEMLTIAHERLDYLKGKGYEDAVIYGEDQLDGLHLITVSKYGLDASGLPADPQVSGMVPMLGFMKPLTGIGAAAIVAGLGISFLTGIGYKRKSVHYDVDTHDIVEDDTGAVVRHIDDEGKE